MARSAFLEWLQATSTAGCAFRFGNRTSNGRTGMDNETPTVARIWRGRTRRDVADEYERYNYEVGIKPLIEKAMGVQTLREDRDDETEFMTISYWKDFEAMAAFTGTDAGAIHHLPRDQEFLIELPESVQVLRLRHSQGTTG
jgi:heme-degrading monooxygenase HmoA